MRVDPALLTGPGVLSVTEGPTAETRTARGHAPEEPARGGAGTPPPSVIGWAVTLAVPCRVVSEANRRDHWTARRKRFDAQAATLFAVWCQSPCYGTNAVSTWGGVITLTHIGRRMDSDNLAGAFKGVRDELARLLGIDDGDPRVEWHYDQRPGKGGIEVRIERRPA